MKAKQFIATSCSRFSILAMLALGSVTSLSYAEPSAKANARFQNALRSVGLNKAQVDAVYYKYVGTLTEEKVRDVAKWLKQQGIQDVPKFITTNPGVLGLDIENNLQLKVNWLVEQKVKDVGAFLSLSPQFLSLSLDKNIKVKALWLEQQGVKDVGKFISLFPAIFNYSIKNNLQPKIELLRKLGVEDPMKAIMMSPAILGQSTASIKTKVKYLKYYGVKDIGDLIGKSPSILSNSVLGYDSKMMWLKNQEVEDISKVLNMYPAFFNQSIKNLDSKAQWFKNQGIENIAHLIETYPQVLGTSIKDNLNPKFKWLNSQGINNPAELVSRYPQILGLSIEDNLGPKMAEYRDVWKLTTEELEKTPIYFGSSLKRVQELRDFLNEIAKMGGAESFDFGRLTELQRRKLIQNLSGDIILGYLKDVKVIDPSRNSLADLSSQERALLGRLYKTNQLSRFFIWKNEFNKDFKQVELGCLFGTIKRGLKIK